MSTEYVPMISKRWLDNALSFQKRREGPDGGPPRARRAEKVSSLARRVMVVTNEIVIIYLRNLDVAYHACRPASHANHTPSQRHDGKN